MYDLGKQVYLGWLCLDAVLISPSVLRFPFPGLLSALWLAEMEKWSRRSRTMQGSGSSLKQVCHALAHYPLNLSKCELCKSASFCSSYRHIIHEHQWAASTIMWTLQLLLCTFLLHHLQWRYCERHPGFICQSYLKLLVCPAAFGGTNAQIDLTHCLSSD